VMLAVSEVGLKLGYERLFFRVQHVEETWFTNEAVAFSKICVLTYISRLLGIFSVRGLTGTKSG
jgi:hypothetical protein